MKISDYKLAEHFLKAICRKYAVPFVDVPIAFEATTPSPDPRAKSASSYRDGKLHIATGPASTLSQTIVQIVALYVHNLSAVTGANSSISDPENMEIIKTITTLSRDFCYASSGLPETEPEQGLTTSLRHFPFVWMFMRDIIVPYYQTVLEDTPVLVGRSSQVDAARLLTKEDKADVPVDVLPAIFVNKEVESQTFRAAYVLAEALRAHDLSPSTVIPDLLGCPDLKKKVYGYVKMAFVVEKEVDEFLLSLGVLAGLDDPKTLIDGLDSSVWYKSAQSNSVANMDHSGGWMAVQLIEGVMDAARGADYSATHHLERIRQDIWKRVAEEKARRGLRDMTLEDLLRAVSVGQKVEPGVTLQALLAENRVW